jgi:hypothetical protein
MCVVTFDTHRIVKRLMEVGFSNLQAEAVTDVLGESRQVDLSHLATKGDLSSTKVELQAEIASTKSELQLALSDTRSDILKWVIGAIGLQTIVVVGAVVMLARAL